MVPLRSSPSLHPHLSRGQTLWGEGVPMRVYEWRSYIGREERGGVSGGLSPTVVYDICQGPF